MGNLAGSARTSASRSSTDSIQTTRASGSRRIQLNDPGFGSSGGLSAVGSLFEGSGQGHRRPPRVVLPWRRTVGERKTAGRRGQNGRENRVASHKYTVNLHLVRGRRSQGPRAGSSPSGACLYGRSFGVDLANGEGKVKADEDVSKAAPMGANFVNVHLEQANFSR